MSTTTLTYVGHVDRTGWETGPWDDEIDKMQWVDEATDLDCLIVRHRRWGNLCGYVGVPADHPCHGLDEGDIHVPGSEYGHPDVHGGLTYSAGCQDDAPEESGICHLVQPGRPDDVHWFGFDCGHSYDIQPGQDAMERAHGHAPCRFGGESYKTVDYVQRECRDLARQLVTAVPNDDEEEDTHV